MSPDGVGLVPAPVRRPAFPEPAPPASCAPYADPHPLPIEIIAVRWWHLGQIAALEASIFGVDRWSEELFWSELAQGRSRCYLAASRAGRIIGYAGLAIDTDEAFVQTIAVDPVARRGALATRLLVALLRHARAAGAHSCLLEVRTDNHPARALYARFGFIDIGRRRGYYQPSGADAYVMRARPVHTAGYGVLLDDLEAGSVQREDRGDRGRGEKEEGRAPGDAWTATGDAAGADVTP